MTLSARSGVSQVGPPTHNLFLGGHCARAIEDGLHGRRDGTLREDASRVRTGAAPQVTAVLRNLVIFLSPYSGRRSLAAATRHHMCHPEKSIELLSTPIRE